jgi:hypothetical protein
VKDGVLLTCEQQIRHNIDKIIKWRKLMQEIVVTTTFDVYCPGGLLYQFPWHKDKLLHPRPGSVK